MADDLTAKGLSIFGELLGEDARAGMEGLLASDQFGSDLGELACQFAFASVWARDGLERKHRSLVTIGILIALRQTDELKNHIRIALANGLTAKEIEESLIQAVPYAGFPAVSSASAAVMEVLREKGLEPNSKTASERGMI